MIMKRLFLTLSILILSAAPLMAQPTALSNTTLSTNINPTQTVFAVASATNIAAGGALYIDHEFMGVVSVSGTTITVTRVNAPTYHSSGAVVYVATAAQKSIVMRPTSGVSRLVGQCSTSSSSTIATALATMVPATPYLPIIDIDTGNLYGCRRNGASGSWVWNITNVQSLNGEAGSAPTAWP